MVDMAKNERVVIVGGGLVGCLLAIYLARRGCRVDVFERHADPRDTRAQAVRPSLNLTLCKRGLDALAAVGIERRVLAQTVPLHGRRIHTGDGKVTYQPYGSRGESIYSISRNALGLELIDAAASHRGVTFHFGEKCVEIDAQSGHARFQNATGRVTDVTATRIFGADGAYSTVRAQLQKTEYFNYSQAYSSHAYKELLIPATSGRDWALPHDALHLWPRRDFMLIGFPNRDGSFALALHAPMQGDHSFATLTDEAELLAFMRTWFPDVADRIPDLSGQFFGQRANSMLTIRCEPWSSGRVLLVGDAAHAILPFYGQGANAGFEDCAVLDRCIDEQADWDAVFVEFERVRRPNMEVMADLCVDHFVELSERLGDSRVLLRHEVERRLEQLDPNRFAPLYSNVAFTSRPYAEAAAIDRGQRALLDRVLALPGMANQTITSIVDRCATEMA